MKFTAKEKRTAKAMYDDLKLIRRAAFPQAGTGDFREITKLAKFSWHLVARWHLNELKKLKGK